MLLSAQEQLEVLRRLRDDPQVKNFSTSLSSSYKSGLADYPGVYDTGRIVTFEGDPHQIMTTTWTMKEARPDGTGYGHGSSSNKIAFFLRKLGDIELVGPIWFDQVESMNEMSVLALAASDLLEDEPIETLLGTSKDHQTYHFAERMTASCIGGCNRSVTGPIRHEEDPRWTEEDRQGFADYVWSLGWRQNGNQIGTMAWWCSETPCVNHDDYCIYTGQWQGTGPDPLWHRYTDEQRKKLRQYPPRYRGRLILELAGEG